MQQIALTSKDKDILFELSLNARISITALAKKVKLSKQVVSYRLQLLEKNSIIQGYYAIINIYQLGMTHYRVFVKFQNMSAEKEETFMNYLTRHPKVAWIADFDGDLDAAFVVWAKNIVEFEEVFRDIKERYGRYFQETHFSIATKIEYLRYKFLNGKEDTSALVFGECCGDYELDELDKKILDGLNKRGRITLVELANKYHSSAKVIKMRMERLIKNRIIIGFNVKLNHALLGYTHYKILMRLNETTPEKMHSLSSYLKMHKNTIYLVTPVGDYDFEVELMTESNEEFHSILKELRSKFAETIKSYNTVIHYTEPKSGQLMEF